MKILALYRQIKSSIQIFVLIVSVLLLNSCHHKEGIVVDESLLSKYNAIANPTSNAKVTEEIDCYLDYSNGMPQKITGISNFTAMLTNLFLGKPVKYYEVGSSDTLKELDKGAVDFRNTSNYIDMVSKLDVALNRMSGNINRSSIFITDFEKIEGSTISNPLAPTSFLKLVDDKAWAQKNFKDWIMAGNQIDIFGTKFSKGGIDNLIYSIVFTPNAIIKNEGTYKKSVLKFLIDNAGNPVHFTYTANNFLIEQEKKDDAIGDANDNLIVQENITTTKDKGFEFYYFKSADLVSFNSDESQKDKRIINKVKISSQLSACFGDVQFGLKAYDITQGLTDFNLSQNQEAPEVKTDVETGSKDTVANKPIKFSYQKGTPVEDIFDFVYNTDTKEIGIKLKPDFTGVTQNMVYQIDIIVKSAKLKDFSDEKNTFKLNYPNKFSISPLSNSIEFAMKDVSTSIENKAVYTIYLKIDK